MSVSEAQPFLPVTTVAASRGEAATARKWIYVGYYRSLTGNHRLRMCTAIDRAHRQLRAS